MPIMTDKRDEAKGPDPLDSDAAQAERAGAQAVRTGKASGEAGFVRVTRAEFYSAIGPQNVCPYPVRPYPYRMDFKTPSGDVRGYEDRDGSFYLYTTGAR